MSKKLNYGSPVKRSVSDLAPVCYDQSQQGERDALRQTSGAGLWHGFPRAFAYTIALSAAERHGKYINL